MNESRLFKFIIIMLILNIICIIPIIPNYINGLSHEIVSSKGNSEASIAGLFENVEINQEIYLQGNLTELDIYLTPYNLPGNESSVNIEIKQGEYSYNSIIKSKDVLDGYNKVDIPRNKFKEGSAIITISPINNGDFIPGSVYITEDSTTGLPGAYIYGEQLDRPISLKYKIQDIGLIDMVGGILILILFVVCIITSALLSFYNEYLETHTKLLYVIAFTMIVIVICIRQPLASYLGEPYSESAYELWYRQTEWGFFKGLMSLTVGLYLNWLEHIVTFISIQIFPTKYVFIGMQIIMTIIIASISSMVCLKEFEKYFSKLSQITLAIFIGIYFYSPTLYMFHALGYWAIVFIVLFAFIDMDKMSTWKYIIALIFTIICCMTRMLYIALLPITLLSLFFHNKYFGKRFIIYCITIVTTLTFNLIYTLVATPVLSNEVGTGSIKFPGILRLVENLFYYLIQNFNNFIFGYEVNNGVILNVTVLLVLLFVIILLIYDYFFVKKNRELSWFLICCIILAFSNVGITIITSASSVDLKDKVDWTKIYIDNDYSNIYSRYNIIVIISIICMILATLYFFKKSKTTNGNSQYRVMCFDKITLIFLFVLIIRFSPHYSYMAYTDISEFPTEWRAVYDVVYNDSYYLPINLGYPYGGISLKHQSECVLLAYDDKGVFGEINPFQEYNQSRVYEEAYVENIQEKKLISLTVKKANNNFRNKYKMIVFDEDNNILESIVQSNSDNRQWITFIPQKPIKGAKKVAFISYETGEPVYVKDALNIGISTI